MSSQQRREFYLPPDEAVEWAEKYLAAGEQAARDGHRAAAVAYFHAALQRQPKPAFDPQAKADTLFIQERFAQGEKLAQSGDLAAAAEAFAQIKAISPNFHFDPQERARGIYEASQK